MSRLFVALQYLLPQHALSRVIHWATRIEVVWFKNLIIRMFVRAFRVDMSEALNPDPTSYRHFNEFFTRALAHGCRQLPPTNGSVACPVDGTISLSGRVSQGMLIQAKDRRYLAADLLGDERMAAQFEDGNFVTIYLAPYNYHRIHMPVRGRLQEMRYLPGRLFSVNAATVRSVPRLFARNERVVCRFETDIGQVAMVLVGALNVGSIETVWAGEVAPGRPRVRAAVHYGEPAIELPMGAEMGRFNMGSTVILLFARDRVQAADHLRPGTVVRMGESIGQTTERAAGQPDRESV